MGIILVHLSIELINGWEFEYLRKTIGRLRTNGDNPTEIGSRRTSKAHNARAATRGVVHVVKNRDR